MRTPSPPHPEVPSHLPSLQVPLLTGTSPAGLCVISVPRVTERSGKGGQGSEQGSPGPLGRMTGPRGGTHVCSWCQRWLISRWAESAPGAPGNTRCRGWEPRGPALPPTPAPSTEVPPPASSEDLFPTRKPGDSPTYGP